MVGQRQGGRKELDTMSIKWLHEYGSMNGGLLFSAAKGLVLYWLTLHDANFFKYLVGLVSLLRAPPPCFHSPEIGRSEPNIP